MVNKKSRPEIKNDLSAIDNIVNVQQIETDTSQGGCSGAEGAPDAPRYVVDGKVWEQLSMFS